MWGPSNIIFLEKKSFGPRQREKVPGGREKACLPVLYSVKCQYRPVQSLISSTGRVHSSKNTVRDRGVSKSNFPRDTRYAVSKTPAALPARDSQVARRTAVRRRRLPTTASA